MKKILTAVLGIAFLASTPAFAGVKDDKAAESADKADKSAKKEKKGKDEKKEEKKDDKKAAGGW